MIENKLKEVLDQRGESLYWLSRATGVGYQRLQLHYNNTAAMIRYPTLEKICVVLKCQPGDILVLKRKQKE